MSIALLKRLERHEQGLCGKCGHRPCECKTSQYIKLRKNGKRGKRRFGRNDVGMVNNYARFYIRDTWKAVGNGAQQS